MGTLDGSPRTWPNETPSLGRQRRRILRPHTVPPGGSPCPVPRSVVPAPTPGSAPSGAVCATPPSSSSRSRPTSTPARDAWLVAIGVALENLADAWNEHVSFTEGPGGLFEELLDESSGEVAPEVDRLRRDHEVLIAHIVRAASSWPHPEPVTTTPGSSCRSPASPSRSTSTAGGAPTSSTGSTASTSPPATSRTTAAPSGVMPTTREPGRPSAKLSRCGSSGVSRSSTCAASRA